MVKNKRFEARLDSETLRKFDLKASQLGLNRTEFLEKISNEPLIFLDNVRQKFKSEIEVENE